MTRLRAAVAAWTCGALLASGCGASWSPAAVVADPQMSNAAARPQTIDILPLDIETWGEANADVDADQIRQDAESGLVGAITEDLYRHGVQVDAMLSWNGTYVGANGATLAALAPGDVAQTINSLARYGERIPPAPAALPVPYLPVRLGTQTGADATLYVGGWGYAGKKETPTGEKVAEGVVIVLIAAVVVVAVIAMAKGGGGGGGGGAASALGHAGGAAGKVAVSASRGAVHGGMNLAMHAGPHVANRIGNDVGNVALNVLDAMGHAQIPGDADNVHPDWSDEADVPHKGSSKMFVEMTLVDNHTGTVLWHAQQRFPADPRKPKDVTRVAKLLMKTFPAGVSAPGMAR